MKIYRLTRELTEEERGGVRDAQALHTGDTVHQYLDHTYGCIREPDIAVSLIPGGPFFPVPRDAVEEVAPITLVRKSQLAQFLAENVDCIPATELKPGDLTFAPSAVTPQQWPLLAFGCVVQITDVKTPAMAVGAAEANGWHWLEIQFDHHGDPCSAMLKSTEIVPRIKPQPTPATPDPTP